MARLVGRARTGTSGAPFLLARRGRKKKHTHQRSRAEKPCDPRSGSEPKHPIQKQNPNRPVRALTIHGKRKTVGFKYLNTSVGSFSSVLYHPLAHLTAFGTPCCKLMTLGFLTPDPHLNRNQPRVLRRKHPTVGGLGHFLSPWQLYLQDGRETRREREGERRTEAETCLAHTVCLRPPSHSSGSRSCAAPRRSNAAKNDWC